MRWTEEQARQAQERLSGGKRPPPFGTPQGQVRSAAKYRNTRAQVDGIWFASKHESTKYLELKFMLASGMIRGFTRQVSLPLASGKRRMVIDFMVVNLDGSIRWLDAKGYATEAWKVKRDELEHSLGIKIETV